MSSDATSKELNELSETLNESNESGLFSLRWTADQINLACEVIEHYNRWPREKRAERKEHLQAVIICGTHLLCAKDEVKRGDWRLWLEANCPRLNVRTATNYMRVAKHILGKVDADDAENSLANN